MDYNQAKTTALLMGANLQVGDVDNTQYCPACGGGDNNDKSFRLQRTENGLFFKCYRLKCGFGGSDKKYSPTGVAPKKHPKPYNHDMRQLSAGEIQSIWNKYIALPVGFWNEFRYSEQQNRVLIPLNDRYGRAWGYEAKKLRLPWIKQDKTKTLLYYNEYPPLKVGWARHESEDYVVITEDILSAYSVAATGVDAASVVGTSLDYNQIGELSQEHRGLIIALDPDAKDKAMKMAAKCRLFFDDVRVVFFERDPKDCTSQEIKDTLGVNAYGATLTEHDSS